jgi:peptidoglycan/xylan/chitin deacetylase (PgdA/CDA1 family)
MTFFESSLLLQQVFLSLSVLSSAMTMHLQAVPMQPPTNVHIPILVYHHIRQQEGWSPATWSWKMTVSPEVFEKQMQWLADRSYTAVNLDTLVEIVEGERVGPLKPVVITFDDNQLNSYENGLPILERYGHTAVFYLITNRLDQSNVINRERALDLLARGMDVQSHTVTHAGLTSLSVAQVDWQLQESKRVLEELTGRPVRHVAYPLTAHNATVRARAQAAGYVTGTIMDPRPVTDGFDLLKLPRIMMTDTTDLERTLP